jgi:hypothetical protein
LIDDYMKEYYIWRLAQSGDFDWSLSALIENHTGMAGWTGIGDFFLITPPGCGSHGQAKGRSHSAPSWPLAFI